MFVLVRPEDYLVEGLDPVEVVDEDLISFGVVQRDNRIATSIVLLIVRLLYCTGIIFSLGNHEEFPATLEEVLPPEFAGLAVHNLGVSLHVELLLLDDFVAVHDLVFLLFVRL